MQILFEKKAYLAPEIFDSDQNRKSLSEYDVCYATKLNDVFALGLVILEAASLMSSRDLYDWDKMNFYIDKMYERID